MADQIKGITVEIGGNTVGLNKALQSTNKEINSTQKELREVEKALKLDPTNTDLLRQKQELLAKSVQDTKTKVDALKAANKTAAESVKNYDAWKSAYDPIKAKIDETTQKLKTLKAAQADLASAGKIDTESYNAIQKEIDGTNADLKNLKAQAKSVSDEFGNPISPEQYRKIQRELATTEAQAKKLETQADKSNVALSKISAGASNLSSAAGKVAGTTAPATLAIAGLGAVCFNAASDIAESQNKVDVAFGSSADNVKKFAETTLNTYGIAKGTALDMSALFGDMATSMGLTQPAAADMSTNLTGLAGDLASFKNIGIDEATTALKGVFTGETESLKNIGVVMTQTNLDAYALANGFGKTTKDMTEAEKVQLRYAYVMDKTKNAQGDFANTSDGAANSVRIAKESLKEASAEFGEVFVPAITAAIQNVTDLVKWFSGLDDGQKKIIVTIAALVAAISPIAGIISAISGAVAILTANPIVLPIMAVVAAIAAVIAIIVVCIKHWDEIKQAAQKAWDGICSAFSSAGQWFQTNVADPIKNTFSRVIDWIKSAWSSVGEFFKNLWNGISSAFKFVFDGLVSIAKAPLNGIIGLLNGAIWAINKLIQGFNRIGFTMPKWLGGGSWSPNLPNIPSIPYLAKGGTVLSGSAVVGEAGPELLTVLGNKTMVQPLTSQQKNVSYGGNVINVYGAPGQDIHELAKIVADEVNFGVQQKGAAFA